MDAAVTVAADSVVVGIAVEALGAVSVLGPASEFAAGAAAGLLDVAA